MMKTSKLLSMFACVAMTASAFAVTANAATVGANENPVAKVEVATVTSSGKAAIDVYFSIDADDLKAFSAEENDDLETVYTGKGIEAIQAAFTLNEEYFDVSSAAVSGAKTLSGAKAVVKSDKSVDFTFAATSQDAWKVTNNMQLCRITANVKDVATMTKDYLSTLPELVDFTAFNVRTQAYPVAGIVDDATGYEFTTYYRLDGNGDYIPTVIEGAEKQPDPPAPTASVAISAAKKTTDANWIAENGNTMFWGVDFANGGFNGTAVAKIFSNDKERELTIATPADTAINGEASFGVFVIVGDSADALGLTVTSGDVTATAAPVAYADAE